MTLNEAFNEMLSSLNPTQNQHERIRTTRETIDAVLMHNKRIHLHPEKQISFFTGSYSRNTIIRPLDDIDLYVRINYGHHAEGKSPLQILRLMTWALKKRYINTQINIDAPCIVIKFLGYKFEIVPAVCYQDNDDIYDIPSPKGKSWIQCYPHIPNKWLASSNQANNKMFIPLIKILKQWKRFKNVPLRSFHLELLTEMVFNTTKITDYPSAILAWMYYASEWLANNSQPFVPEPGKTYPCVDQYLYESKPMLFMVRKKLEWAVQRAEKAYDHCLHDKISRAKFIYLILFGNKFPK